MIRMRKSSLRKNIEKSILDTRNKTIVSEFNKEKEVD